MFVHLYAGDVPYIIQNALHFYAIVYMSAEERQPVIPICDRYTLQDDVIGFIFGYCVSIYVDVYISLTQL